ncbi:Multidrug resistance protein stp [compost metagenome]
MRMEGSTGCLPTVKKGNPTTTHHRKPITTRDDTMPLTTTRARLLMLALLIAEVCSAFEVSMIYAALPTLNRQFGDPASVSWVISACFLMSAIAAALCGRLGDLLGRKQLLLAALASCAVGSLISGFSATLGGVIVGATLQGVSGAIMSLCYGLAREWMPAAKVPVAIGTITAAAALGSGAGLMLGGVIVDNYSWNTMFFVSGSYALLCVAVVFFLVPSKRRAASQFQQINLVRGILFAPAIAGMLLAVKFGPAWQWDWRSIGLLALSIALFVTWIHLQWRADYPLINLRLFTQRRVLIAYICMALTGIGALQIAQIMSTFLQQPGWTGAGFALSATMAGAILLPSNLVGLIASPLSGKVAGHYGARQAVILAGAMIFLGWGMLVLVHHDLWVVGSLIVLCAFGFSMMYAGIPNLIIESVPENQTSEATGLAAVVRATSMAIGAQIIGMILSSSTVTSDDPLITAQLPSASAFVLGFGFIALTGLLSLLLAWSALTRQGYKAQKAVEAH